jgi:hypothetical protein
LLEAAAEDVAVVNLLIWEWCDTISNILAFSGQRPALEVPGHMVVVNSMNVHRTRDWLLLLNCHRVVYPLSAGEPGPFQAWTLADWCDQCHRKGGLVVGDAPGKLPAELLPGKVDALLLDGIENPDVDSRLGLESPLKPWFDLLDGGLRVPLVGGSGKDDNLTCLGSTRTYARLAPEQPFTYKNWIEAVRAGRTFVTTGPLLFFTVNGQDPGAVLSVPRTESRLRVRAEARSFAPFECLEVMASSHVVARATPTAECPSSALIETEFDMPAGGWLMARCWGAWDGALEGWSGAQSSPVYVRVEG